MSLFVWEQAEKAEKLVLQKMQHMHKFGTRKGLVSAFYQVEESLKKLSWVTEVGRKAQK